MNKTKTVLVDADQIFYQILAAHQYEDRFTGDEFADAWTVEGDTYLASNVSEAKQQLVDRLQSFHLNYERVILCFTSTPNFRHDVLSSYKGGRLKKRKPLGYWDVVGEFVDSDSWETRKIEGLEADDVMSILATSPKFLQVNEVTIFSQDKDMLQVPGVTIDRGGGVVVSPISLADANQFRYTQTLTGDLVDGYKGLKGYGPKKAERYLDEHYGADESVLIDAVVSAYLDSGCTARDAYKQIDCACILRHHEFDFNTRQPILKGDN